MHARQQIIPALIFIALGAVCPSQADLVTDWNETALNAIKIDKTPPPKAARALAILHAAIFDAIDGITQTHDRYLVTGKPAGAASPEAAVTAAAHWILGRTFPAQHAAFDAAHEKSLAAIPDSPEKYAGLHWGEWAANVILLARSTDHSDDEPAYAPSATPGEWQPTPPASAPALLPQWPEVACFAMTSGSQFRPPKMPALTSAIYAFEFNLTKQLGAKDSPSRTLEQTVIAHFWSDGSGTVTPPGHWNVIARDVAAHRNLSLAESARLFALLNIAEADAAILCWDCKYAWNFWRPITAIQNADADGNPATEKDANWTPQLPTPPFPEYTSGHSTFSGAAATVLATFFGSDDIPFTTTSDGLPGFSRSYKSFSEAAAEAGMSRIFGGIHFMSANQQGLASGTRMAAYVMENFLRSRTASLAPGITSTAPSLPRPMQDVAKAVEPAIAPELEDREPAHVGVAVPETQLVTTIPSFYAPLESHGEWMEIEGFGYVFRPQVAVKQAGWRPYADGHWVHSDYGWTWESNEEFGWATYHYGRWARLAGIGWVWVPGREWAPAWVSWRRGVDYCGWAPLPPESGGRLSFSGSVDRDYDAGPMAYIFVPGKSFGAHSYTNVAEPAEHNPAIIGKTLNVTEISYDTTGGKTLVYNGGPSLELLWVQSELPVEEAKLEFASQNTSAKLTGTREGNTLKVVAPPPNLAGAAATAAPANVKTKMGRRKIDNGWEGIDPALTQKMRQEIAATSRARPQKTPATGVSIASAAPKEAVRAVAPAPGPVQPPPNINVIKPAALNLQPPKQAQPSEEPPKSNDAPQEN